MYRTSPVMQLWPVLNVVAGCCLMVVTLWNNVYLIFWEPVGLPLFCIFFCGNVIAKCVHSGEILYILGLGAGRAQVRQHKSKAIHPLDFIIRSVRVSVRVRVCACVRACVRACERDNCHVYWVNVSSLVFFCKIGMCIQSLCLCLHLRIMSVRTLK